MANTTCRIRFLKKYRWPVYAAKLYWIALLLTASPQLAHSTPLPTYAPDIRIGAVQEWNDLDPHKSYDWLAYQTINAIGGNLTAIDTSIQRFLPDIATKIDISENGHVLTFVLDKNRYFHDGTPITAQDVVYSLNRVTHPDTNSPGAGFFKSIEGYQDYRAGKTSGLSGVTAIDPYTVQIRLTRPTYSLLYILTTNFGCILPDGHIPTKSTTQNKHQIPSRFISAGPYVIDDTMEGQTLHLKPSPYSFDHYLYNFNNIKITAGLPEIRTMAMFANNEIDIILDGLPWTSINAVHTENAAIISRVNLATTFISLNTSIAPFGNRLVRKAVNHAIDRNKLEILLGGAATSTTHILPPNMPSFTANQEIYQHDTGLARQLMEEAGFSELFVDMYAVDTKLYLEIVYSIVADLADIGIQVKAHFGNHAQVIEAANKDPAIQMVFSDGLAWIADYPDPSNFYYPLLTEEAISEGGWNWSRYINDEVHQLALEADSLFSISDQTLRLEKWKEVFAIIEDDAPWVPLYNRKNTAVIADTIYQHVANNMGLDPGNHTIDYMYTYKTKRSNEKN